MRTDFVKLSFDSHHHTRGFFMRPGRPVRDPELLPSHESMRRGSRCYGLSTNVRTAPLRRWLHAQLGRPWANVASEACQVFSPRTKLGQELRKQLQYLVETTNVVMRADGAWCEVSTYTTEPYRVSGLYVHPRTGLLCEQASSRPTASALRQQHKQAAEAVRRELSDSLQLHRLEGLWYEVRLEEVPVLPLLKTTPEQWARTHRLDRGPEPYVYSYDNPPYDVVLREHRYREFGATPRPSYRAREFYGRSDVYAVSKRQLSSKELKHYGLTEVA